MKNAQKVYWKFVHKLLLDEGDGSDGLLFHQATSRRAIQETQQGNHEPHRNGDCKYTITKSDFVDPRSMLEDYKVATC